MMDSQQQMCYIEPISCLVRISQQAPTYIVNWKMCYYVKYYFSFFYLSLFWVFFFIPVLDARISAYPNFYFILSINLYCTWSKDIFWSYYIHFFSKKWLKKDLRTIWEFWSYCFSNWEQFEILRRSGKIIEM